MTSSKRRPTLRAGQIGIDESRAQEITANLRPNPNLTILADQIDPFSGGPPHGPFAYLLSSGSVSQLWERQHKRGLRLESAQKATAIATAGQADLERNLLFNLRGASVAFALLGALLFSMVIAPALGAGR